jgi:hypothetical protein
MGDVRNHRAAVWFNGVLADIGFTNDCRIIQWTHNLAKPRGQKHVSASCQHPYQPQGAERSHSPHRIGENPVHEAIPDPSQRNKIHETAGSHSYRGRRRNPPLARQAGGKTENLSSVSSTPPHSVPSIVPLMDRAKKRQIRGFGARSGSVQASVRLGNPEPPFRMAIVATQGPSRGSGRPLSLPVAWPFQKGSFDETNVQSQG